MSEEKWTEKIIILVDTWNKLVARAQRESNSAQKLPVVEVKNAFQKAIKEVEKVAGSYNINLKHARLYNNYVSAKSDGYFVSDGYCSRCQVKYEIIIKTKEQIGTNYVEAQVTRHGEHGEHEGNVQARGEVRDKMKNDLKTIPADDYFYEQAANHAEIQPSKEALRKMKQEMNHKDDFSDNWRDNIITATMTSATQRIGRVVNGFVRRVIFEQDFFMQLHCQEQVDCFQRVPNKYRVLYADATGNLMRILKSQRQYSKILSYFLLMKDLRDLDKPKSDVAILTEFHTSRQDTFQIAQGFDLYVDDVLKQFKKIQISCRLVVSDYAWGTIHGLAKAFNNESIIVYCNRTYDEVVSNKDFNDVKDKSYFISCAAHTMHRFSKGIRSIIKDKAKHSFACFVFSLMLNCTELNEMTTIFKAILVVYKSETKSKQFQTSYNQLVGMIRNRKDLDDKDKFENESYVEKDKEMTKCPKLAKTIKSQSKFGILFNEIESSQEIHDNGEIVNDFHCAAFIQFLQFHFMPYCFLWAGFVMKGIKTATRITSGTIESFFGGRKRRVTSPLQPVQYMNAVFKTTLGRAEKFYPKNQVNNKESNNNDTDDDDDDLNDYDNYDNFDVSEMNAPEVDAAQAVEGWNKKVKSRNVVNKNKNGFYQKDNKHFQKIHYFSDEEEEQVEEESQHELDYTLNNHNNIEMSLRHQHHHDYIINLPSTLDASLMHSIVNNISLHESPHKTQQNSTENQSISFNQDSDIETPYKKANKKRKVLRLTKDDFSIIENDNRKDLVVNSVINDKRNVEIDFSLLKDSVLEADSNNFDDYVWYDVNNIKIKLREIRTLEGNNWINDSVIEAYLSTLYSDKKVFVLSCDSARRILLEGECKSLKKKLSNFKYIVAPVQPNSNHWAALFVSIEDHSFTYLDPLVQNNEELIEPFFDNWCAFCESKKDLREIEWTKKIINHPLQQDMNNCGLFVSLFIKHLLRNFNDINDTDPYAQVRESREQLKRDIAEFGKKSNNNKRKEKICTICAANKHSDLEREEQAWNQCSKCTRHYHSLCFSGQNYQLKTFVCDLCLSKVD